MKGPWDPGSQRFAQTKDAAPGGNAGTALVSFYTTFISPIDGSRCPMYPSCSIYAVRCFKRHGFLMGWIMTIDRLYRCGRDALERCPVVFIDGRAKFFDPVDCNDFWWHHGIP
ncbi:MAG: membrane protein insertion efficiency factor YidD, partial [Deltaproteobacteria bacterium]|nr:membrane protein insertion efficiency factor YidD [Deltaproteobacteria bacterium]